VGTVSTLAAGCRLRGAVVEETKGSDDARLRDRFLSDRRLEIFHVKLFFYTYVSHVEEESAPRTVGRVVRLINEIV
jgi:hypothetical protein